MRLKQHHDPPPARTQLCGRERRTNLSRMMAVIINYEHAVHFALRLETPSRSSEAVKTLNNLFKSHFQLKSNRDRRQRVVDVVHARHTQDHLTHHVGAAPHAETRSEIAVVPD